MKFSLFFEMQLADASAANEARIFHECLEQAVLADHLGYHAIWEVEHHGLYQYSHSSAPEIFLAFVASKTTRIRVGHGCTLLPHRYNHPIRIAERIATLDILSNGRVNWGTARSGSRVEREAFEVDVSALSDEWREALGMIPRMWTEHPYSFEGRFFRIPPTYIIPRPVQKPHPPIFAACSKPADAEAVGALGIGALNLAMHREDELAARITAYRRAVATSTPVGLVVNNHFACNPAAFVLKDDRRACRHGLTGSMYFTQAMIHYYGQDRPVGPIPVSPDVVPDHYIDSFRQTRNTARSQLSSIIGDPVAARESVQRFVDAGVDELILVMQTGPNSHELTMESIRTFGEQVLPHFA